MTTEDEIQTLVGPQFEALAQILATAPTSIGDRPSLCEGWTVRNVLAHVTMAARYDEQAFAAEIAAAGNDFGVLSEKIARRDGELTFEALLDDLRSTTMAQWAPPGGGASGALSHVVIHGLDITAATDLPRTASDQATTLVLNALVDGGVASRFGVDPTSRRLQATDLDWHAGDGLPLEASAGDLVLALTGRKRRGLDLGAA